MGNPESSACKNPKQDVRGQAQKSHTLIPAVQSTQLGGKEKLAEPVPSPPKRRDPISLLL